MNGIAWALAHVLDDLSTEQPSSDNAWQERDIMALEDWSALETVLRDVNTTGQSSGARTFDALVHTFHTALPFSEAERGWLLRVHMEEPRAASLADIPKILSQREERVVSEGLHRTISGRDLMRRWLSWRRESNEFSGTISKHVAREALRGMIEMIAPGYELPTSYDALRERADQDFLEDV